MEEYVKQEQEENGGILEGKSVFVGVDLSRTEDDTVICRVRIREGEMYVESWEHIKAGHRKLIGGQ